MMDDNALVFEEQLLREPHNVMYWFDYIQSQTSFKKRVTLYERALARVPGSYKLWFNYLSDRVKSCRKRVFTHRKYAICNQTFERALAFMHKMPRIWIMYCEFLMSQRLITRSRHAFDRALRSLPVTQHDRIWPMYIDFVTSCGVWQTAVHVYERFLKFDRSKVEDYVDYLFSIKRFGEAARQLAGLLNDPSFKSASGKTKHQLWVQLCDVMSKHPNDTKDILSVEAIIRTGLKKFSDETGRLWCALADFYIRQGEFERARVIYEEAIAVVMTVRDFSTVFDAYSQFEEATLSAKMSVLDDVDTDNNQDTETNRQETDDIDFRLARLEHLMERRPRLLNSVRLRQNPNNVHEWHKRVQLHANDPVKTIEVYRDAVATVDPHLAIGKVHTLWVSFAKFYETNDMLSDAQVVLKHARDAVFRKPDDLAVVFCESAELEIRHKNFKQALALLKAAVQPPTDRELVERNNQIRQLKVQGRHSEIKELQESDSHLLVKQRLHKSTRLWSMYVDLEEAFGTLESTRAAYDRMIELNVATPKTILNYAALLEEKKYFEESFRAFEKGIAAFPWPHVYEIWLQYLSKFVGHYHGTRLERTRELFEQALRSCPSKEAKTIYLLYANFEEKHGLTVHVMAVYDRACAKVEEEDKLELYRLYVAKVEQYYGVTKTREVYERGIEELPDSQAKELALQYAEMEKSLGEVDRARAIYSHGAQFCDPKVVASYWNTWNQFEIALGNEDTYRDMLRIKNTVAASFGEASYELGSEAQEPAPSIDAMMEESNIGGATIGGFQLGSAAQKQQASAISMLEDRAIAQQGKRSADQAQLDEHAAMIKQKVANTQPAKDDAEIDIDDENTEIDLEMQQVPQSVFGAGLKNGDKKPMGALARLQAAGKQQG